MGVPRNARAMGAVAEVVHLLRPTNSIHPASQMSPLAHTHTQVSLSILTARGGVLGSGLELRQPRPSGLRLDGANDPFETRLVRGSSVGFELGFETGGVLWSNPPCLVCGGGSEKKGVGGWWCNAAETGLGSGGRSRLGVVKLVGW